MSKSSHKKFEKGNWVFVPVTKRSKKEAVVVGVAFSRDYGQEELTGLDKRQKYRPLIRGIVGGMDREHQPPAECPEDHTVSPVGAV